MGVVGLFAFGRALWWASGRHVAAIAGMILLASDFAWFVQSRIAMLDMVMAGFAFVGLWMLAAAVALPMGAAPGQRRWRLALAGVNFGLALGAKWSVAPVLAVCGIGMVAAQLRGGRRRDADSGPAPGISLAELVLWLGSVPLVTYWATFWPAFFYLRDPVSPLAMVSWHRYMIELQSSVIKHHPYQSVWTQWVINWRAIWYLYEPVDGAQRGIVLIGNPFTMLAGLVALGWCGWAGWARRRRDAAAVVVLYAATLALWIVGNKPVQFYYHYLLPGTFLMAGLALAVDALWQSDRRWRREAFGILLLSLAVFGWFWPILSAQPLHKGTDSFEDWMWLGSWR
jgi:dolichyl-phosphate-mannose--protein O-mannosyl transferase